MDACPLPFPFFGVSFSRPVNLGLFGALLQPPAPEKRSLNNFHFSWKSEINLNVSLSSIIFAFLHNLPRAHAWGCFSATLRCSQSEYPRWPFFQCDMSFCDPRELFSPLQVSCKPSASSGSCLLMSSLRHALKESSKFRLSFFRIVFDCFFRLMKWQTSRKKN